MNFATSRKGKTKSWKDGGKPAKKAKSWKDEAGEEDEPEEEADAFKQLKRELAERERTKAHRTKELAKAAAVIERTRGGEDELEKKPGVLVYMDIDIPKRSTHEPGKGRMIFELFEDVVPRTAKNFLCLITGEKGDGLHLLNSVFFRVEPGKAVTGGDIDRNDGSGGRSIYGRDFENENFTLKHTNAGVLTMHARRANANNSQFQILLEERPDLDGKQTVFGRLVDGFAILREIEKLGTANGAPKELARISACGVCAKHATLGEAIEAYQSELVLPKEFTDMKTMARNYRNKTNYYDNSTRSALFSWTTSC
mmetsp:Transcript_26908/g.80664  ORF Transcript_26908/g.80664 Transcript_26908/m.80664 type:complete len:311 (+) Transcript_26908:127-1059(+)